MELAHRSLRDTLSVALAARSDALASVACQLPPAAHWAALAHVLDYDDLHVASTTHISVVCVAATLATGGDARAYLAGAGAMARIGRLLGWGHYASGWHITCTAGAPASAVSAGVAMQLSPDQLTNAIALAVPGAGGNQRAFGSQAKALQVGFAAAAGVRAAQLAAAGATADPLAVDQWLGLVQGKPQTIDADGPALDQGLAIKIFPCCYALQRPIFATQAVSARGADAIDVIGLEVETPEVTLQPLIHHRPTTGLQAKFSLEYAIAATLLDHHPGFDSFSDAAVGRDEAQRLIRLVETQTTPGGNDLLEGEFTLAVRLRDGSRLRETLAVPPGAPTRPPSEQEMAAKFADCGPDVPGLLRNVSWSNAAGVLDEQCPSKPVATTRARRMSECIT